MPRFSPSLRHNVLFFCLHYLVTLALCGIFTREYGFSASPLQGLWMVLTLLSYPAVYLAPGLLASSLCLLSSRRPLKILALLLAVSWTSLTEFLLLLDTIILKQFDYHINGLVINLLITPGGFEAMGLDQATLLPAIISVVLAICANIALFCLLQRQEGRFAGLVQRLAPRKRHVVIGLATLAVMFVASMFILAFADFYSRKDVLISTHSYPLTFSMRMRSFLKALGCTQPPREKSLFAEDAHNVSQLNYPDVPIRRQALAQPYNVIWLTAESLRADLLSPEVMPNTWKLAQNSIHALKHISGGHGTRPAMFSMFYGLYGNNWHSFLNAKRPPVLFDWMHQDNYQFLVQTSARFTYPEFDQTIFSSIPGDKMFTFTGKPVWKRDVDGTDHLLQFLANATSERPFFAFHFFEGTHAPYTFNEQLVLTDDYLRHINYATVSAKDAKQLYNRQVNAAYNLDHQIGRILEALHARPELARRTVVLITGDHGEEFFEHGRLGHNSTFVNEQIHVPLVLHIPGRAPQTISHLTHHTDLVATLAPLFGVQNPPEDYCLGQDITSPEYRRTHYIVCGWNIETLVTKDFKYILPTGAGAKYYGRNIFDAQDQPLPDDDPFLKTHTTEILKANHDMHRFLLQDDD